MHLVISLSELHLAGEAYPGHIFKVLTRDPAVRVRKESKCPTRTLAFFNYIFFQLKFKCHLATNRQWEENAFHAYQETSLLE